MGTVNPRSPPPLIMPRVLRPTTSPWVFTRGPPELPGLIEASVCSHELYSLDPGR